ncbi:MAG: hypothetical protein IKW99_01165 [Bacteroidales bacterium]|nr:hypothetical protein [Bacteroidales bacterium]
MKIQKLFLSILAAASLFAGCKEPEPEPTIPSLTVGQTELSFEQNGGTGNITVTSNRPWTISTDADWLAFNPSSGNAADAPVTVTVTALANSSTDRTASFKVKTDFDFRTVEVSQKGAKGEDPNVTPSGSGTANDPYNVAAALEKAKSLQAFNTNDDLNSSNSANVYTAGKVVSVDIDPSYGNATYYISADGTSTVQLEVYRGKYLEGVAFTDKDQLKVGDDVVVYGTLVNFKGDTPEYTTGSKLISVNGETKAPEIDYTKYELITVSAFIEKANSSQFYRLKGKVSKFNKNFCSFDLTDDSGTIYVYNVANKDDWSEKISNGGTVELAGLYTLYTNKTTGATQHEVVSAQILTFEAGSGSEEMGEPKGTGTLEDPYNPAGAAAAVKDLTWTSNEDYQSTGDVYVMGKICKIANNGTFTEGGTYGNASFYISEDGEGDGEFYVFRTLYLGNKKFESSQTDIKVGDEVIIYGKLMNYRGNTPETVSGNSYLYSLNGVTGGDTPQPPTPGEVKAVTVAEFNAAPESDSQVYELVGTIGGSINMTYGNFDLTDETGTVYVYGLTATELGYGMKNDKSYESLGLKEGDKIKLHGYRGSFEGKIEVMYAWFIEKVSGGGDNPGPGPTGDPNGTGTLEDPYNPAGAAAAASKLTYTDKNNYETTEDVYVKGKICKIANSGTFTEGGTYGNASFFISEDGTGDGEFYVFRTLYLGNKKFEEGQTDIKVGDEVIICGKLMNYKGNTPETEANSSYLYSLNGVTDGGDVPGPGGDNPGPGPGGDEVSGNAILFSSLNIENGTQYNGSGDDKTVVKSTDFTVAFGKGANDGKYYKTGEGIRTYGNGYIKIESSSKTITKVVYTFQKATGTSGSGDNSVTYKTYPISSDCSVNTGSITVGEATVTWSGSSKSIIMTRAAGSGHWRLQKVEVSFAE